jgi:alpha-tubulin suppressor-like RCC1 family protein
VVSATGGNGLGCAVLADGTVWCWGENEGGYLGLGNKSGTACGGLNGTNQHKCSPSPVQVASLGNDNKSISTGGYCVLKNDGLVWCLGPRPGDGELVPLPVPALTDVESIANGCAIKHDGTLWCKAVNNWATPVAADVKSAASGQATCFVKNDGTVWCVGANDVGQLGTGSTTPASTTTPIQVKALGSDGAEILGNGGSFCALKTDGSVWCWGWDHYGELGDGKETGGTAFPSPTQVEALGNDVLHLAKGVSLTPCARKKDGSVWCWGSNVWAGAGTGSVLAGAVTPSQVHGAICQ